MPGRRHPAFKVAITATRLQRPQQAQILVDAGDGGLGPLLLTPTVCTGLSVQAAQGVTRSVGKARRIIDDRDAG